LLGLVQTLAPIAVLLLGAAFVEAVSSLATNSIPRGYTLGFVLLIGFIVLGLFASYRQQSELDGRGDEVAAAVGSLRSRVLDVNAHDWSQADVFLWAGDALVLRHLSEGELAVVVANQMKMRSIDAVKIDRVLNDWDLAGLVRWELITPDRTNDITGLSLNPYNSYKLTDLGKRVLARLKDGDSA
jgi:hypothetical protein